VQVVPHGLLFKRERRGFYFKIMSVRATTWAYDQEIFQSSKKFVLVALCDYCGDSGTAYPGLETLCRMTALSEDTVTRCLDALVADGLISDTGKRAGNTGRVKVYQLQDEAYLNRKIKSPQGAEITPQGNPRTIPAQSPHNPRTIPASCGSPIYRDPRSMIHEPVQDGILSELRNRLNELFGRQETDRWSYLEETLLSQISSRQKCISELETILNANLEFMPQSIDGLLENWTRTLDRARTQPRRNQPKKRTLEQVLQDKSDAEGQRFLNTPLPESLRE
jgi:hypothetical protein